MSDYEYLDLGPETQDFDDSEDTLDFGFPGDEDDASFLDLDLDVFWDPYTGEPEVDAWDYGPDYDLDEFDY